jgi:D-alanyl-D-alanine dipeptidase
MTTPTLRRFAEQAVWHTESIDRKLLAPIPLDVPEVAWWKSVPIEPSDSYELVPIGMFAPEYSDIFTSALYYGQYQDSPYAPGQLRGAMPTIFVRRSVAKRLRQAQLLLPPTLRLVVFDGYRSTEVQQSLYDHYYGALRALHPSWTADALSTETQEYVSVPSTDETKPSPHSTGGAVDVAILEMDKNAAGHFYALQKRMQQEQPIADLASVLDPARLRQQPNPFTAPNHASNSMRKWLNYQEMLAGIVTTNGKMLHFGTPFDHGDIEASLRYLEVQSRQRGLTPKELEARDNRRLLYNLMRLAGLQGYLPEWWHYNAPETQMGAKTAGLSTASYGKALLSGANQNFVAAITRYDRDNPHRATTLSRAAVIAPSARAA